MSELIGDYAQLAGGVRYGRVDDVLINENGEIKAVLVYPDIVYRRREPIAWPFYGYEHGFDPSQIFYAVPHSLEEVNDVEAFVYPPVTRQAN